MAQMTGWNLWCVRWNKAAIDAILLSHSLTFHPAIPEKACPSGLICPIILCNTGCNEMTFQVCVGDALWDFKGFHIQPYEMQHNCVFVNYSIFKQTLLVFNQAPVPI